MSDFAAHLHQQDTRDASSGVDQGVHRNQAEANSSLSGHHEHQSGTSVARGWVPQRRINQELQQFWSSRTETPVSANDFKIQILPLARIKKIMKAEEDVKMIGAEGPPLFARACEFFILELTRRAWSHTERNNHRTLQKSDVIAAVQQTDTFDFLIDLLPRDTRRTTYARGSVPFSESGMGGGVSMMYPGKGHDGPTTSEVNNVEETEGVASSLDVDRLQDAVHHESQDENGSMQGSEGMEVPAQTAGEQTSALLENHPLPMPPEVEYVSHNDELGIQAPVK